MRKQPPKQSVKEAAVGYLSRRDHAEKELRQKLKNRGYESAEIDEAVAFCQDYNWLDDARFAGQMLRNGLAKGWGLLRIRQELKLKGVHEVVVRQLLDEDEIDWFEHARAVARRKFGETQADTPKEQAKRVRFMQYRGFDFEQIKYAFGVDEEY